MDDRILRLSADFNGLFGKVLCLSHRETCRGADGGDVEVREGQQVIAFEPDLDDEGNPDDLVAAGIVARPPEGLLHTGSRWVLLIDEHGVRHQSDLGLE